MSSRPVLQDKIKEVIQEEKKMILMLKSWFLNTILQLKEPRLFKEMANPRIRTHRMNKNHLEYLIVLESEEILKKGTEAFQRQ